MKKTIITILISILTMGSIIAQNECKGAIEKAKRDFRKSEFSFHSQEFVPPVSTYCYVLKKYYNINWFFTDSMEYYKCYDSVMIALLKSKYGKDFLQKASKLSDSLEKTKNWIKDASFPGGEKAFVKFISLHVKKELIKKSNKTAYVEFEIDSTGKVENPKIVKGINTKIDKKIIEIIKQMPDWEPKYLFGKPIRTHYNLPIRLDERK